MKRLKKIISILIRILYFVLLASLLLAYLAPYANPKGYWPLAFFGLSYPYLLLANTLFLIWWIIRWNKLYWLSLACILMGWINMKNLFHFGSGETNKQAGAKVLSFNVRLFDLYNWTENKNTRDEIYSLLKNESADIVCLQEFFHSEAGAFSTLDTLISLTGSSEQHVEYTVSRKKKDHWGIATFSKYPIVNRGTIRFKTLTNNICIFSDLRINKDTIRVYNLHLQSISFGKADYRFLEALKEQNDTLGAQAIENASKNILRRLRRAFIKRSEQAEKVLAHMASSPYPLIVCGDFNDTPFSYTYNAFAEKLLDAFMESGNGMGRTYLGIFPSYRIDYIMHSKELRSSGFEVLPDKLSDHYPVHCYINTTPSN